MKGRAKITFLVAVLAILASGIAVLSRKAVEREEKLSSLTKEKLELDQLRAENGKMKGIRVDGAEIDRLREENSVLPKLRNQLRQELVNGVAHLDRVRTGQAHHTEIDGAAARAGLFVEP